MLVWCLSSHLRHFHHYLFKYFITFLSLPSSVILMIHTFLYWWYSIGSSVCSFSFILLSFCSSEWVISIILSSSLLILSSANSDLLLNPSCETLFQNYCIFSFKFSIWFLFIASLYWNSYFWDMIFQISFTSLVVVSFSSLNVLKTVDFMSLTNNSYVGSSSGIVSVKLFFYPVNRHHLPVYFVNFVVAFENQIFWTQELPQHNIQNIWFSKATTKLTK